jgi:hypothetical protein
VVSSQFWAPCVTGLTGRGHRSDQSECWPCSHVAHWSDWCWRPVRAELMQLLCFLQVVCMYSSRGVALVQGELACVQVELFVVFEFWFGGLCSLLEHSFVSDVSSYCPCLRGRDLSSSSDLALCLSLAFDRLLEVSFYSFLFFSLKLQYVCCQCTHQGGD